MNISSVLAGKDRKIVAATPDTSVSDVVALLHRSNVGAVLVMDGATLLGVLSERGIVRALALDGAAALSKSAGSAMRRIECMVGPNDTIEDAMALMTDFRVRYLSVIEDGQVIGVVSIGDLVHAQLGRRSLEVESLTSYITSG